MSGKYLLSLLLPAGSSAMADIVSCAWEASRSTTVCRQTSQQAKSKADALSADYAKKVEGKSVKQTADMLAEVTRKITAIYQSAEALCNSSVASCRQQCAGGEGAGLAGACGEEMGKYLAQVGDGRARNENGTRGGQLSSSLSQGKDRDASSKNAAGKAGSIVIANPNTSAIPGPSNTKAGAGVPMAKPLTSVTSSLKLGGGAINGRFAQILLESRCSKSAATDPACATFRAERFCATAGTSQCPSCDTSVSAKIKRAEDAVLDQVCTSKCMADPAFGPQLGDLCRLAVMKTAQRETQRAPAGISRGKGGAAKNAPSWSDYQRWGTTVPRRPSRTSNATLRVLEPKPENYLRLSLFQIHSRVIASMCRNSRLSCDR